MAHSAAQLKTYAERTARRNSGILEAAIVEALAHGYQWITRKEVAKRAGYAAGCVNLVYPTMFDLKRAVLREAVERAPGDPRYLALVGQGLANGSPVVAGISPELRSAAADALAR